MLEFEVKGSNTIRLKLEKMTSNSVKAVQKELSKLGLEIVTFIRLGMKNSPPDTSKKYLRQKGRGIYHHPSFAGNFPRIDSGNLIKNITYHTTMRGLTAGDINRTPYAIFLEEGTKYMKPRPFLKPTWEHFRPIIPNRLMEAIKRNTK
jgi:HK97 gp10 family phage protein